MTWFTASLVLFPALVAGILLLRGRPWARVALAAVLLRLRRPSRDLVLVRFGTGYNYDHWPDLLAGLARRL